MIKLFEDVLTIRNGKNQRAVENPTGKYPIYGSGGIMGRADACLCGANTVVIGRKGSINNPIYVEEPFWNVDTAFGLVANPAILHPRYLFYFCKHFDFERLNKTVTIPSLTKSDLLKIRIDIPEYSLQEIIVDQLYHIEQCIQLRKKQLTELDNLVKAQFVEMFGDTVSNSKNWHTEKLSTVCKAIYGGGTPSKSHPEYFEGNIPWVSPKDMKSAVIFDSIDHITEEAVRSSTTKMVPIGAVLMVIRSGILKHTLPVAIAAVELTVNQDMKAFIVGDNLTPEFLMYYFKAIEANVLSGVRGVTADNIDFKTFQQKQVIVPPLSLQKQFSTFVTQVDKSKFAYATGGNLLHFALQYI